MSRKPSKLTAIRTTFIPNRTPTIHMKELVMIQKQVELKIRQQDIMYPNAVTVIIQIIKYLSILKIYDSVTLKFMDDMVKVARVMNETKHEKLITWNKYPWKKIIDSLSLHISIQFGSTEWESCVPTSMAVDLGYYATTRDHIDFAHNIKLLRNTYN
jgi:hypothetical protein